MVAERGHRYDCLCCHHGDSPGLTRLFSLCVQTTDDIAYHLCYNCSVDSGFYAQLGLSFTEANSLYINKSALST